MYASYFVDEPKISISRRYTESADGTSGGKPHLCILVCRSASPVLVSLAQNGSSNIVDARDVPHITHVWSGVLTEQLMAPKHKAADKLNSVYLQIVETRLFTFTDVPRRC